jgi:hypothetical protein
MTTTTKSLSKMTTTELMEKDAEIGNLLDLPYDAHWMPDDTLRHKREFLRDRREVRAELDRRHAAR